MKHAVVLATEEIGVAGLHESADPFCKNLAHRGRAIISAYLRQRGLILTESTSASADHSYSFADLLTTPLSSLTSR